VKITKTAMSAVAIVAIAAIEPSRGTVPDYPLAGKLWQAPATVKAVVS
jgi:hypothetical protein